VVAGREATPQDTANTERLKRWATEGPGAAHFMWGAPGDFDRCVAFFREHTTMSEAMVKGYCSNLHVRATGARPGHAPGEQAAHQAKTAAEGKG
jgi:hypothetical protein